MLLWGAQSFLRRPTGSRLCRSVFVLDYDAVIFTLENTAKIVGIAKINPPSILNLTGVARGNNGKITQFRIILWRKSPGSCWTHQYKPLPWHVLLYSYAHFPKNSKTKERPSGPRFKVSSCARLLDRRASTKRSLTGSSAARFFALSEFVWLAAKSRSSNLKRGNPKETMERHVRSFTRIHSGRFEH